MSFNLKTVTDFCTNIWIKQKFPPTKVIGHIQDWHVHSTTGMSLPRFQLSSGTWHNSSDKQKFLYNNIYTGMYTDLKNLKEQEHAEIIMAVNGDVMDGDHHETSEIISRVQFDMVNHAHGLLKPIFDLSTWAFFVYGTPAHSGKDGFLEEALATKFRDSEKHAKTKKLIWHTEGDSDGEGAVNGHYMFSAVINGKRVNFSHFGQIGRNTWTRMNPLRKIAREIVEDCRIRGIEQPNLVYRAHAHGYGDTGDEFADFDMRVISLPPGQLPTSYGSTFISTTRTIIPGYTITVIYPDGKVDARTKLFDYQKMNPTKLMEL